MQLAIGFSVNSWATPSSYLSGFSFKKMKETENYKYFFFFFGQSQDFLNTFSKCLSNKAYFLLPVIQTCLLACVLVCTEY